MQFYKQILPSGLRLITVPMPEHPTVTVMVLAEAGSKNETKEQSGLSHFLEHMCFKGTAKRPKALDISRELDSLGAEYNAFTSHEYTGYHARAQAQKLETILEIIADIYIHPSLPSTELEQEKNVIIEEINLYEDMPNHSVGDLFMELLYGDQPAGRNIAGTQASVKALTSNQLSDYHRQHYTAPATTVVIAGNFDQKTIVQLVEKTFVDLPQTATLQKVLVQEQQTKPALKIKYKETDQAHLVLGVRTFDTFDKRNRALLVLTEILGGGMSSRLFQEMREKRGLGYYVRASKDSFTDHGFMAVSAGVTKSKVIEAIDVITQEFRMLKETLVAPAELDRVKQYLVGMMYLGLEGSQDLANFYGGQEIIHKPLLKPEELEQQIRAVTAEEIQSIARQIFIPENFNLAIVGPYKEDGEFVKMLRM